MNNDIIVLNISDMAVSELLNLISILSQEENKYAVERIRSYIVERYKVPDINTLTCWEYDRGRSGGI